MFEQKPRRDTPAVGSDAGDCTAGQRPGSKGSRRLPRARGNYRLGEFTQGQIDAEVHSEDIVAVRYGEGKRRTAVPVPDFSGIDPVPT